MRNSHRHGIFLILVGLTTETFVQRGVAQTSWTFQCSPSPRYICKSSSSITSVPNSLFSSATETVFLWNNSIAFINATRDFLGTSIISMSLSYNKFTSLPCIPNIRTTITQLFFINNLISYVDPTCVSMHTHLQLLELQANLLTSFPDFALSSLTSLYLGFNKFTEFPNLPLLGKSLTYLEATDNPVEYLSASALMSYRNLTTVDLTALPISTLPSMCALPANPSVIFTLDLTMLYCDCRLRWLKTSFTITSIYTPPKCSGPPLLAGQLLDNVNMQQLTCSGRKSTSFSRAASNFYCSNPPTVARYIVSDISSCATKCLTNAYCSSFNLGKLSASNVLYCDITGWGPSISTTSSAGLAISWDFYIAD